LASFAPHSLVVKTGKSPRIQAKRLRLILTNLDQAESAQDMDLPGLQLHELKGSRKTLSKVLNGRGAITPEMALRLELVFEKPSADHWLRLQNVYDLWQSRQNKSALHVQPYRSNYA